MVWPRRWRWASFGVIPAWQATGGSLARVMASESRSATSTSRRFRSLLVSGEVAAAVVLLCGAGLLLQTLLKLVGGDTGYRATSESVLTLDFSVPTGRTHGIQPRKRSHSSTTRWVATSARCPRCAASAGRRACRTARASWVGGRSRSSAIRRSRRAIDRRAEYTTADPGYFSTLDLPIVSGRGFNERDTLRSLPVCLVNEAFVRRHFEGRNRSARVCTTAPPSTQIREIVGVARQTSGEPDALEELLQVYVPLAQFPTGDVYMVVQPSAGAAER